jgi:hypothetical protein
MQQKILFRLIRFAIPVTVFLGAAQAVAFYTVTVKNATLQDINIKIDQAVCPQLNYSVKAGETKSMDTGGCCSKKVTITGGIFSATYTPPDTGFWMSCGGYSFTVSMKKSETSESGSSNASVPTAFDASMLNFDSSTISNGFLIEEGIH